MTIADVHRLHSDRSELVRTILAVFESARVACERASAEMMDAGLLPEANYLAMVASELDQRGADCARVAVTKDLTRMEAAGREQAAAPVSHPNPPATNAGAAALANDIAKAFADLPLYTADRSQTRECAEKFLVLARQRLVLGNVELARKTLDAAREIVRQR